MGTLPRVVDLENPEIRAADHTHPRSGKHTCEADRTPAKRTALAVFDVYFCLSIRYKSQFSNYGKLEFITSLIARCFIKHWQSLFCFLVFTFDNWNFSIFLCEINLNEDNNFPEDYGVFFSLCRCRYCSA
jgi:hypothetical protein